ncbi:hypothetical protein MUG87_03390 [Ectobacillus sp. JY-23]|uniref:hypothetical protein n=1 Tax=Ectobacillus sp. JY-23 TaxID=2933872 RepID=UPI001FF5712C|nr:hypothetical protein [Ectobacillus sp. JY-23]UOY93188.1 hypothetical protein MUG87_03390 [Ectobacillus sp. JY-23]
MTVANVILPNVKNMMGFIQPLLLRATDCYIYPAAENIEWYKQSPELFIPTRNKYRLNLDYDFSNCEMFVQTEGQTDVLVIVMETKQFHKLELSTARIDERTAIPAPVLRYCKDTVKRNKVAFCLYAADRNVAAAIFIPENTSSALRFAQ